MSICFNDYDKSGVARYKNYLTYRHTSYTDFVGMQSIGGGVER